MEFMALDLTPDSAKTSAVRVVQHFTDSMLPKTLNTFGYVDVDHDVRLTPTSRKWPKVFFALDFIMRNIFGFPRVLAVKLGTKISKFPASKGSAYSVICWWRDNFKDIETLETNAAESTSTSDIVGPAWPLYNYVQILMSSDTDPDIADIPGELADELNRLPDEEQSVNGSLPSRLSTIAEGFK